MFSYDGQAQVIKSDPIAVPPLDKEIPDVSREELWESVTLLPNVTPLGLGQAYLGSREVEADGIYFQATVGSAKNVADKVGLRVYEIGSLLFFATVVVGDAKVTKEKKLDDVSLAEAVLKTALLNPDAGLEPLAHKALDRVAADIGSMRYVHTDGWSTVVKPRPRTEPRLPTSRRELSQEIKSLLYDVTIGPATVKGKKMRGWYGWGDRQEAQWVADDLGLSLYSTAKRPTGVVDWFIPFRQKRV